MKINKLTADQLLASSQHATTLTEVASNLGLNKRYFKTSVVDALKNNTGVDLRAILRKNIETAELERSKHEYICKQCGTKFRILPGAYSTGDFCSKSCARKFSSSLAGNHRKIIACMHCGTPVEVDARASKILCEKCRVSFGSRTAKSTKPISFGGDKARKTCLCCGTTIPENKRYAGRKFCSTACSVKYLQAQRFRQIEERGEFPKAFMGEANRPTIRAYLEHKTGHVCAICGTSMWFGKPVPLVVDHIDGNAFNNKIENVRLVCANCDALLPTYKGANIGRGRAARYKQQWYRTVKNIPASSN